MPKAQLDLFAGAPPVPPQPVEAGRRGPMPEALDDAALIAAIPQARLGEGPALAAEAGRRRLATAVPALESLCRRFIGFGCEREVPEQVAALQALAAIGGGEAAQVVARLLARGAVQGPTQRVAVLAAVRLGARLSEEVVTALLRHSDPVVRAAACRCIRRCPAVIPLLLELLDDLHETVGHAAACALARMGRMEARPIVLALLRRSPGAEAIDAVTAVADEDCIVELGRIAEGDSGLSRAALEALEAIDHPLAERRAGAIRAARGEG